MLAHALPFNKMFPALAAMLMAALPITAAAESADAWTAERALLERVQRESPGPLWIRDGQPGAQARELLAILQKVEDFGLSSQDFAALMPTLEAPVDRLDAARFEQAMNLAALRLMRYLHDGRVDPGDAGYELSRRRAPIDLLVMLKSLASSSNVNATLAALEPRSSQYRALKQWLARYRGIADRFDASSVPGVNSIRVGDAYSGAADLRRRLAELGDAPQPAATTPAGEGRYDTTLAAAVAQFQGRHGLQPDGVLGPQTRAMLEVPISRRVRQIELTLERWRWLPDLRAPAVIVNVPQYMLYTLPDPADAGEVAQIRKIPVIVGKQERQTPVFDSAIEAVVFRPYWDVPYKIAQEEFLPLIERDAGYLARHDMEIVRGGGQEVRVLPAGPPAVSALRAGRARLRQRPGPQNALGLIKFLLNAKGEVDRAAIPLESAVPDLVFARKTG